jgi:SARP family transcriptional regulator, regulator of embCAB operon
VRIYLTGRLIIESESGLLDEEDLPARQGRIAFAYMVLNRRRPIPRPELASALWDDSPPEAWEASLSALLSRIRSLFRRARLDADFEALSGNVHVRLPADLWVDLDAARNALDEAEGLMRSGKPRQAWPPTLIGYSVFERGFLHGEEKRWIVRERERILGEHLRSLELLSDITLALGEPTAAVRFARMCCDLDPFRESAYEREMRAELQLGNRAEALKTYDRLRKVLADELGADPSAHLQAAFLDALRE